MSKNISKSKNTGYVYAILLACGAVKVGMSKTDPHGRLKTHSHTAKLMRSSVYRYVVSGLLADPKSAEENLIDVCKSTSEPLSGREWFEGADFEKLEAKISNDYSGDSADTISKAVAIYKKNSSATVRNIRDFFIPESPKDDFFYLYDDLNIGGSIKSELLMVISRAGGKALYDYAVYQNMGCPSVVFITTNAVYSAYPNGCDKFDSLVDYLSDFELRKKDIADDIGCDPDELADPLAFSVDISTPLLARQWREVLEMQS